MEQREAARIAQAEHARQRQEHLARRKLRRELAAQQAATNPVAMPRKKAALPGLSSQPPPVPAELRGGTNPGDIVTVPSNVPVIARSRNDLLDQFAARVQRGTVAEVGVFEAGFTLQIARRLQPEKLYAIDNWECGDGDRHERIARLNLAAFLFVEIIRSPSHVAALTLPDECLDFLYLDATHDRAEVYRDLCYWWPKCKRGAWFAGHDFCSHNIHGFTTIEGVNDFLRDHHATLLGMTAYTPEEFPSFVIEKP